MQITLELLDNLVRHFDSRRIGREIVEALAVQAYQTEKITHAQVGKILGLSSHWAVDSFLKENNANLHYDEGDLERDRETLRQLHVQHSKSAS